MRQNHALILMINSRVYSTPHLSSFGSSYQYCQLRLRAQTNKQTRLSVCLSVSHQLVRRVKKSMMCARNVSMMEPRISVMSREKFIANRTDSRPALYENAEKVSPIGSRT